MQAVIYTRVSKDVSAGRSVQDQESECRALCERNGWSVRRVFCDNDIGASRHSVKERPAWNRLKADLKAGDILVVWEASRAQRDLEEFVELRNLCASLSVPLSYAGRVLDLTLGDDRFAGGLDALIAEREAEQIRTRVLRGKRGAAAEGRPPGRPPWGYRRVDVAKWVPDSVEAPRIKEAVARILSGESRYSVLRWLRETPGYSPASLTMMNRALGNPTIAGLRLHQGEVVGRGNWEPLITEGQHQRLGGRYHRSQKLQGPEPKYLLSGIAVCGVCEDPRGLRYKRKKGRNDYYQCNKGCCTRPVPYLDDLVLKKLLEVLEEVDPTQYESDDPVADSAIQEIERLERQLGEWTENAIAEGVSPGAFAKVEKGLKDRISALRPKTSTSKFRRLTADQLRRGWPALSTREKREIIRGYLVIRVFPGGRGGVVDIHGV